MVCVCVEHLKRCKTSTLIDGIVFSYQVLCHYNKPVLSILPGVYPISFSIAGSVTVDFLVTPTKLWKSTGWKFKWSVFARKTHTTSEFAKMFLSKCVIHAGFVKVA